MDLLIYLLLLSGITSTLALICRTCESSEPYAGGEEDCYSKNLITGSSIECAADNYYCRTKFTIVDGFLVAVKRGCIDPTKDQDQNTDAMPSYDECVVNSTAMLTNGQEVVECYYSCNDDVECSNEFYARNLLTCNGSCNNGFCDYFNGVCRCLDGYSGGQCDRRSSVAYRMCVQCSEEINPGCATSTAATPCPEGTDKLNFCSVTKTTLITSEGDESRSAVTKACTSTLTFKNECFFTKTGDKNFHEITEYTCTSTCSENGCNIDIPDGKLEEETTSLYCVVCKDETGSGNCSFVEERALCPASAKFCKTTVVYYASNKNHLEYLEYRNYALVSVVRECAEREVEAKCTNSSIGKLSAEKVTCTETCTTDGCNTGWPVRPKCSRCKSVPDSEEYDSCLVNAPLPTPCDYPIEAYCTTHAVSKLPTSKNSRKILRGCSYYDIGNRCKTVNSGNIEVEYCNKTCDTDGCNQGIFNNSPSAFTLNLVLIVLLLAVVAILLST